MIRKLNSQDTDRVLEIWLASNIQAHPFVPEEYWQGNYQQVKEQLQSALVYVYEERQTILGFVGLVDRYVAGIFVDSACRGRGIGKQLLEEAKRDRPELFLHVYQKNTRALAFYLREGFTAIDLLLDQETGQAEWLMRWNKRPDEQDAGKKVPERGKPFVSAVIVAAGNSTRMGESKPFIFLENKPVLANVLAAFDQVEEIGEIVIVCRKQEQEKARSILQTYPIAKPVLFAQGGDTRQQSVSNGICCTSSQAAYFAIHDGARVLVTPQLIQNVLADAFTYGASAAAMPVKDTIKEIDKNGFVSSTPDRSKIWAVQTPQIFQRAAYLNAMCRAQAAGKDYTDDCQLLEQAGAKVHLCMGSYENLKLTTQEDLILAQTILSRRNQE